MQNIIKEYGWSALITVATAFLGVLAVSPVPVDQAALFALLAAGARAGVAALINLLATGGRTISSK